MFSSSSDQPAAPALQAAVDSLDVAVEHLIKLVDDGALTDLGAFGLVAMLQSLERVRNKLPVVDRAMIQYGIEQGVPGGAVGADHDPGADAVPPPVRRVCVPPRPGRRAPRRPDQHDR